MEEFYRDVWQRLQEILPPAVRNRTNLKVDYDDAPDDDELKVSMPRGLGAIYQQVVNSVATDTIAMMILIDKARIEASGGGEA